ncbi:MAG: hypothetical protein JRF63_09830, partial [Deltaproteobacteria bacterium]|nr:hypothetical protein [Deltaproteobacteria bacterium]
WHLAHIYGNRYASAWISPPDDYEPIEMDGPDQSTLVSLPDYQNLWFLTFELE